MLSRKKAEKSSEAADEYGVVRPATLSHDLLF